MTARATLDLRKIFFGGLRFAFEWGHSPGVYDAGLSTPETRVRFPLAPPNFGGLGGEIKTQTVPIERVTPYANNPRRNEDAIEKVASLDRQVRFPAADRRG